MPRSAMIDILDGAHPGWGRGPALALYGLILLSAGAVAVETVEGLPAWLARGLYGFQVLILLIFTTEYILRLTCSPHPLRHALSLWGVVDLLSCASSIAFLQPQWQAVRTLRLIRLLKLFRTSAAVDRLGRALSLVKGELAVFGALSALVLYVSAVGIYLFEHEAQPEAFSSIPKSLWWAVSSFTTVGYGDVYPVTTGGRIFTSIVLLIGLGVVAVPSAIVTAALMDTKANDAEPHTRKTNQGRPK